MIINAKDFKPKKRGQSDKFSWNIYRFLKKYESIDLAVIRLGWNVINGECDLDQGSTWLIINYPDQHFISGNRINRIMCNPEAYSFGCFGDKHYSSFDKLDITEQFFREYARNGRCAISDRFHEWIEINKNSRKCAHCGKHERRATVTKKTIKRLDTWS